MNKPTARLIEWADAEIGVLIHFDTEVFEPRWVHINGKKLNPPPDVKKFNPTQLNTDQWIQAAKIAGAKYAVLTAKHVTGFTLFPDTEYAYAVDKTPYKQGKGDIVKDFVNSCRKYDLKPGIYYSCEANSYINIHKGSGNLPKYPSPEWDYFKQLVTRHLTHLWTQYGDLFEIWFDGGLLENGPDYQGLLAKYQPNAVTFQGPETHPHRIRWVGNERGLAPYPCWATIHSTIAYDGTQEIGEINKGEPNGKYWIPAETDVPLRYMQWMWAPNQDFLPATPGIMMKWYFESVGRNSNLLIGVVIDDRGLVPEADISVLEEFGKVLKDRFTNPIQKVKGEGNTIGITAKTPFTFNCVEIMEDISEGHLVRSFIIEISNDGKKWNVIQTGTAIGHKYLSWVSPQTASHIRLNIIQHVGIPKIHKFALYSLKELEDEFEK